MTQSQIARGRQSVAQAASGSNRAEGGALCPDPTGRAFRLAVRVGAMLLFVGALASGAAGWALRDSGYLYAMLSCLSASGALLWTSIRIRPNAGRRCVALERAAYVDPLTGQRNLQKFVIDAERQLQSAKHARYSIAYLNIKGFKHINDIFGRDVGEQLIRYVADYIAKCAQPGEVYGRVGADVFAILGTQYNDELRLARRYDKARRHLAAFPPLASRGFTVDLYAGIYRVNSEDGPLSVSDMLDRAAIAERSAKAVGSRKVGFFTSEMREKWRFEADIETRLETALQNRAFEIYLQPKVDIQGGRGIVGMEALARWTVNGQTLPPGRFIPVLEKNGSIFKLDRHIFESACRFYRAHGFADMDSPPVMGVNVSRAGILQPDFLRTYCSIKRKYAIPDRCIELEFTESVAMGDRRELSSIVDRCHEAGFLCSLDDFGAGYSSLNVLKSVRVDVLKLDGEFFRDSDDPERGRQLVEHIVKMARAIGMRTVAEGVETQQEVERLRQLGCDAVQGFVFARPMSEQAFLRLFQRLREAPASGGDAQ